MKTITAELTTLQLLGKSVLGNGNQSKEAEPAKKTEFSPYIVKYYDTYTDRENGRACFILEYMDGLSLNKLVEVNVHINETDLAVIAYSVLKALAYLHARNLFHRDIKVIYDTWQPYFANKTNVMITTILLVY